MWYEKFCFACYYFPLQQTHNINVIVCATVNKYSVILIISVDISSSFKDIDIADVGTVMESPVGTTYELRSHSLLPVGPRMTDKADSCGELTIAVITDKASCICGLVCGDGLTCRTFPSPALLYCSDNTNFLKVLHPGEASFLPFESVVS